MERGISVFAKNQIVNIKMIGEIGPQETAYKCAFPLLVAAGSLFTETFRIAFCSKPVQVLMPQMKIAFQAREHVLSKVKSLSRIS